MWQMKGDGSVATCLKALLLKQVASQVVKEELTPNKLAIRQAEGEYILHRIG